jgi:FLVCR family feline leukemia virus subgroup C receptor-related protein
MKHRLSERPNFNYPHNVRIQQQQKHRALPLPSSSLLITSTTTTLGMVKGLANNIDDEYPMEPIVYPQRWTQLAYLSILALLSDWICFSVAASPDGFETAYPGSSAASLIDIFLFTNVASCFLVTDVVAKFGLGRSIKGAAAIMTCGCLLRSGIPDPSSYLHSLSSSETPGSWMANAIDVIESISTSHIQLAYKAIDILPDRIEALVDTSTLTEASKAAGLEPYTLLVIGTILVGFAQPYFQCTPPRLSATWFASDERASATATALNFNQIGIAVAFLVGGQMGQNESGIHDYFNLITLLCMTATIGTVLQFQDKPQSPPSYSEIEKLVRGVVEPPFLVSARKLFNTKGFKVPLAAFICSISITNIVGTFIDDVMEMGGITEQLGVDLAGAGFELAILVGGIVIGGYVDETKQYKPVTLACLAATMFFVVPLGLTDHMLGNEPVLLVLALLGLGLACGPIQPINAELAVDVTYPCDETAVESVQQVGGNLVSALMVPVAEWALHQDYEFFRQIRPLDLDIRGDVMLMFALAAVTIVYFTTFDAPLRRTMADDGIDDTEEKWSNS